MTIQKITTGQSIEQDLINTIIQTVNNNESKLSQVNIQNSAYTVANKTYYVEDLNNIYKGLYYYSPSSKNIPKANTYGIVITLSVYLGETSNSNWIFQLAINTTDTIIKYRKKINQGNWTTWVDTHPRELAASLSNGFNYEAYGNIVTIHGHYTTSSSETVTIGTMPEGLRPSTYVAVPTCTVNGSYLECGINGVVKLVAKPGNNYCQLTYYCNYE